MPKERAVTLEAQAQLLDLIWDAILLHAMDGTITYWSMGAERIYGWTKEETLGENSHSLLKTEFPQPLGEIQAAVELEGRWEGTLVHTAREGRRVTVASRWTIQKDEAGRPVAYLEINNDITHLATAEETHARLAAIVESSDDAIIGKNLEGVITSWNRGAQQLYGYTTEEVVGRSISLLVPPDMPDEIPHILDKIKRGEKVDHYQTVRMGKGSRRIDVSLTVSPIRNAAGSIIGASSIARDITEQKRLQAELEETNAELEAFAYSVSHDLKAPLRGMHGFAQALLEDYGDQLDAEGREYAERIMAAADRLHGMIQDLLEYSRLSRARLDLQPVSLRKVVKAAMAQLEAQLRERDVRVTVREPLPEVMGHPTTLVQVVVNLLSNAAKFVPPDRPPEVRVWAEGADGRVRLWIEDNGIGIPADYHQQIFRVFERLHGEESYPGTGIGLAIARKGIERMGGRVGVESEPGLGSRFWIELSKGEQKR